MEHACVMVHIQVLDAQSMHAKTPAIIADTVAVMVSVNAPLDGQEKLVTFQCAPQTYQTNHALIMVNAKKSRWMTPQCTDIVRATLVGQVLGVQMLRALKGTSKTQRSVALKDVLEEVCAEAENVFAIQGLLVEAALEKHAKMNAHTMVDVTPEYVSVILATKVRAAKREHAQKIAMDVVFVLLILNVTVAKDGVDRLALIKHAHAIVPQMEHASMALATASSVFQVLHV